MRKPCAIVPPNGVARALEVDVHELVVERDVGERVDARLVDDEPLGHAELAADEGRKLLSRDRFGHRFSAGAAAPYRWRSDCRQGPDPK